MNTSSTMPPGDGRAQLACLVIAAKKFARVARDKPADGRVSADESQRNRALCGFHAAARNCGWVAERGEDFLGLQTTGRTESFCVLLGRGTETPFRYSEHRGEKFHVFVRR